MLCGHIQAIATMEGTMISKNYSGLLQLNSFEERFNYLVLYGVVGKDTFGFDRYMNQQFYRSSEWKKVRDYVIVRDGGCDLGVRGYEITGKILVHHINPISGDDIKHSSELLLDPNNLICASEDTHNAIHYGNSDYLKSKQIIIRRPGDTSLW